jgi:hypothetical protein
MALFRGAVICQTVNCVNRSRYKTVQKNKSVCKPRAIRDWTAFGGAQWLKRVFAIDPNAVRSDHQ